MIVQSANTEKASTTPIMTQNAFTSRFDFIGEFTVIHAARKTDEQVDAAFTLFYGAKNIDVRDPLVRTLLEMFVAKGLLAANRVKDLLQELPTDVRGALDPVTELPFTL